MKKILALLIASLMLTAGTAFAAQLGAGVVIEAADGAASPDTYRLPAFAKMSTGVSLGYATSIGTYAIQTKHVNGDRCFGAAANDGKNYWQDCAVNSVAGDLTDSDSTAFNGWHSL